ncbi:DUF4381 domain-containing protein [Parahaliea aestuarii]|uniref:DUF4381 domain-containing protein n=1 Tax=Parahaliea aestuarii TaxID=1852021 RepID=A0A5C9A163_9GAMM|nr:DUF4381 domain-containing protein [Parahaliea aestuarii]TXS93337.1 DUF4381 domain-containing protein [Parahaliea aestuarii]
MQATDPLANLQPLRTPAEPGWWPPAPGWWLLAGLCLLLLALAAWQIWRRHRRRRYRRQALAELSRLQSTWPADDDSGFSAQCNRLLKAVALRSFPRTEVAALSGERWREFLNGSIKGVQGELFPASFSASHYRPAVEPVARDAIYQSCQLWIRKHEASL